MEKILAMKANITEEEKNRIIEEMMGYKIGEINFDVDDSEIIKSTKREQVRKEMVAYLTQILQEEFNLEDSLEAQLKWDEYKEKHGIVIKE